MGELTPLELSYLRDCVERGGTRCNDGGTADAILSAMCSKPNRDAPYVAWRMNPDRQRDGYISLYEATDQGRAALAQGGGHG